MIKKLNGFIKVGLICILVSIIIIAIGINKSQSVNERLAKLPVISDKEMLIAALNDSPKKYIIMNATLTGEVCEDKLGILSDEYVYLAYSSYYFTLRSKANDSMTYDSSWEWGDTFEAQGGNPVIFGDIPLKAKEYRMYCNYVDLSKAVKAEYAEKIAWDNSLSYYYPDKIKDVENNKRYSLSGVLQGQKVAFVALVGNGEVVLSSLNDEEELCISGFNDMDSLEYTQDKSVGTLGLIGFVLLALGVFINILGILDILGNKLEKKRTNKR